MSVDFERFRSFIDMIDGWLLPGQDRFLFRKAQSLPDNAVIVEIGAHLGKSTIALACACIGTKRRVLSIDTWTDTEHGDLFPDWTRNITRAGVDAFVHAMRGDPVDILLRWEEINPQITIDLLFIDGSHEYCDVRSHFLHGFPLVNDGGLVLFHDVASYGPGPQRVWHTIAKPQLVNHEYESSLATGVKSTQSPMQLIRAGTGKLLWIRPDAIGDALLSSSMLPLLQARIPHEHLIVVCDERVASVYRNCPYVQDVLQFERQKLFSDSAYYSEFKMQIKNTGADVCVQSIRTPEPIADEFVFVSGARVSIGFLRSSKSTPDPEYINRMFNISIDPHFASCSELAHHESFLNALGDVSPVGLRPTIWLSADDRAFAAEIFNRHDVKLKTAISFFAGAQSAKRIYQHYASALRLVPELREYAIFALGSDSDHIPNLNALEGLPNKVINLNGMTTICQAAAIIEQSVLAIGAETGLAHAACAVGTPNVVVLGGGHFGRFMPYSELTSAVTLPLDCFGCDWQCKYTRAHCVKDIPPEILANAIRAQLRKGTGIGPRPKVYIPAGFHTVGKGGPKYDEAKVKSDAFEIEFCRSGALNRASMATDEVLLSICIVTNAGLEEQSHRKELLRRLLASIKTAGLPSNTEILVAGAVPTNVDANILAMPDSAANGRIGEMRNRLGEKARGKFIIQCDDDILFSAGYWGGIEKRLSGDVDILCTRLLNPNGTRYWDWAAFDPARGQTLLPYGVFDRNVYATGGHLLYRRSVLSAVQWNPKMLHGSNEEYSFATDAKQKGGRFGFCLDATVYLQYHHCDAQAVIDGRPQQAKESFCKGYVLALAAIGVDVSSVNECTPAPNAPDDQDDRRGVLLQRVQHKLSRQGRALQSIEVSILTCCSRYVQRFRVFAQSICRQVYDLSKIEVIVGNPHSPDGLSAHVSLLKKAYRYPTFEDVLLGSEHARNRGLMIQEAFKRSRGQIIIGMDCDLVLPPDFLTRIVETVRTNPNRVVGVYRNFLTPETTAGILTGGRDPFAEFQALKIEDQEEKHGYRGVLGYCQATTRDAWEAVGYPTEFDEIAKSDVAFNERLAKFGVTPMFLRDVTVLHLNHERNWMGTDGFL